MRLLQVLIGFGGNAPPQLAVLRELVARGHEVRVVAHEGARDAVEAAGATLVPFVRTLPGLDLTRPETDPVRDWEPRTALGGAARFRNRGIIAPLPDTAHDVGDALDEWPADAVLFDFLLLGAAIAAEARSIPALALVHCPYPGPVERTPPLGSGLRPATGPLGRVQEGIARRVIDRFYAPVLGAVNPVRSELGLEPLHHWSDQLLHSH